VRLLPGQKAGGLGIGGWPGGRGSVASAEALESATKPDTIKLATKDILRVTVIISLRDKTLEHTGTTYLSSREGMCQRPSMASESHPIEKDAALREKKCRPALWFLHTRYRKKIILFQLFQSLVLLFST